MPKFIITTLGCKVNQYESASLSENLKKSGWESVQKENTSDLCIINTCAVTQKASMQSRQAIRQAYRANPKARIVVTGCYAQTEPDELKQIKGIELIVGHADKHNIPAIIQSSTRKNTSYPVTICPDVRHEIDFRQPPLVAAGNRTRPFLKIQDGCDAFCTYCIVPYARGRSRSMPMQTVMESIKQLQRSGYREVVLSGIHLGCYGLDLSPETNLLTLLNRIQKSKPIHRVRLSSIEPHELTDDIIQLAANSDIICHHFHVPLQSGDDHILKKMQRPYSRSYFRNLILKIHTLLPDAAIGVDTLIGFPGESQEAFANTYNLIKDLPVTYLHVFPFSSRKKTPASKYAGKVPPDIIKSRCRKMRHLGKEKKKSFFRKNIGKTVEVLVESKRDSQSGFLKGITSNYIPVFFEGDDHLKNTIARIRIAKLNGHDAVIGTLS